MLKIRKIQLMICYKTWKTPVQDFSQKSFKSILSLYATVNSSKKSLKLHALIFDKT